jgi:hypothetical protein
MHGSWNLEDEPAVNNKREISHQSVRKKLGETKAPTVLFVRRIHFLFVEVFVGAWLVLVVL